MCPDFQEIKGGQVHFPWLVVQVIPTALVRVVVELIVTISRIVTTNFRPIVGIVLVVTNLGTS